jgi:hypothetical protein
MKNQFFCGGCVFLAGVILLGFVAVATGQPTSYQVRGMSVGEDEVRSISVDERTQGARNPDARELARLRVEWGKPSIGFWTGTTESGKSSPEWQESNVSPDRVLRVSGRLMFALDDAKSLKPLGRVQPLRVILARSPSEHPDWTRRHDRKDSTWADCIASADGVFDAELPLGGLQRRPAIASDFQVALSLGRRSAGWITWYNAASVLPRSMGSLRIPGPPRLSATVEAINGAPSSLLGDAFDPAKLVRAVNGLQPLGKDKAIKELRQFLEIAPRHHSGNRDPANIDTADRHCVYWIVRLLFEPMDPKGELPAMTFGQMFPLNYETGKQGWPLFPLALKDDVPFLLMSGSAIGGGHYKQPEWHLQWVEEHGRVRRELLLPADDPLATADAVLATPQARRVHDPDFETMLHRQALRSISHLIQPLLRPQDLDTYSIVLSGAEWAAYRRLAEKRKIRWSADLQQYVAAEPRASSP